MKEYPRAGQIVRINTPGKGLHNKRVKVIRPLPDIGAVELDLSGKPWISLKDIMPVSRKLNLANGTEL